jgi:hypothetical protein
MPAKQLPALKLNFSSCGVYIARFRAPTIADWSASTAWRCISLVTWLDRYMVMAMVAWAQRSRTIFRVNSGDQEHRGGRVPQVMEADLQNAGGGNRSGELARQGVRVKVATRRVVCPLKISHGRRSSLWDRLLRD